MPSSSSTAASQLPHVLTFARSGASGQTGPDLYSMLLQNFLMHFKARFASYPMRILPHCLDDAILAVCREHEHGRVKTPGARWPRISCVRASCCNASQGQLSGAPRRAESRWVSEPDGARDEYIRQMRLKEAIMIYKLRALRDELASSVGRPVILLDVDALVLSPDCLNEWLAYPEDLAVQTGGAPGCPRRAYQKMGVVVNTGAVRANSGPALAFLNWVLDLRDSSEGAGFTYEHHCWEQELLNRALASTEPHWRRFPDVLETVLDATEHSLLAQGLRAARENLTLRMLNYSRWPAAPPIPNSGKPHVQQIDGRLLPRETPDNISTWTWQTRAAFRANPILWRGIGESTCIFHPAGDYTKSIETWRRNGLWYLESNHSSGYDSQPD